MSRPSEPSPFSVPTRGYPQHVPFSPPTFSAAPSDGSSETEGLSPPSVTSLLGPLESKERRSDSNAGAGSRRKKQAWNVTAGGANEAARVMGADSWPALSDSAPLASVKSTSCDSVKSLPDESSAIPSKSDDTSSTMSSNEGPAASRQYPTLSQMSQVVNEGQEPSHEDLCNKDSTNLDQRRSAEVMQQQQTGGSHRRGSYGGKRRVNNSANTGGGSHHGRHGNRRDHERGGHDWNAPHGFGRNPHMWMPLPQLHAQSQPFIPPPPPAGMPFISIPPPGRPFMSPMGYPDATPYYFPPPPPPEVLARVPFVTQMPSVVSPAMFQFPLDQQRVKLMEQIEYYFSVDNLCKDIFLRKNMDDRGWVPISLIATFNRMTGDSHYCLPEEDSDVKQLTTNTQYILDALRGSTILEIQGDKVRRRNDWMNWILSSTPPSDYNSVVAHMHTLGFEDSSSPRSTRHTPD